MAKNDVWLQSGSHVHVHGGPFCRYLACLVTRRQECMHFYCSSRRGGCRRGPFLSLFSVVWSPGDKNVCIFTWLPPPGLQNVCIFTSPPSHRVAFCRYLSLFGHLATRCFWTVEKRRKNCYKLQKMTKNDVWLQRGSYFEMHGGFFVAI